MSIRASIVLLTLLSLVLQAGAKDKKKQALPDTVLNAQRVLVVIYPDAGEPVTDMGANSTARDNVEKALMKWGRFGLALEPQTADLVIAVRKGHGSGPTISNSPTDNRPVIYQPSGADTRESAMKLDRRTMSLTSTWAEWSIPWTRHPCGATWEEMH
jgi:hypothetical protein